jgi:hypothetical protein
MIFEKSKTIEKIGLKIGFVFSYFMFTTILFFVMVFLDKLPATWNYGYIMIITLAITLLGAYVKKVLQ